MKLNKIQFARVISLVSRFAGRSLFDDEMMDLDAAIDVEIPTQQVNTAKCSDVDQLMTLMTEGTRKIEAIKTYRMITGAYLKEAKDAVEKHWIDKPIDKRDLPGIDGAL